MSDIIGLTFMAIAGIIVFVVGLFVGWQAGWMWREEMYKQRQGRILAGGK